MGYNHNTNTLTSKAPCGPSPFYLSSCVLPTSGLDSSANYTHSLPWVAAYPVPLLSPPFSSHPLALKHWLVKMSKRYLIRKPSSVASVDSSPSSSHPAYFLCRILPLIIQLHVCLLGFFVVKLAHLILLATTPSWSKIIKEDAIF